MAKRIDPVGLRIGRLIITEFAGIKVTPMGVRRTLWRCLCDCGGETTISAKIIAAKTSQSCGCLQKERVSISAKTHGESKTKLYKVWTAMRQRCNNPNDQQYENYGARGITVCDRWNASFASFKADVGVGRRGLSLDRIDNNKGYGPDNFRWATGSEQLSNTRRTIHIAHNGETMTLKQWSVRLGFPYMTLARRLKAGWTVEKSIETPINLNRSNTHRRRLAMSSDDSL